MSDPTGPVMLAATQVMRPGRTRIGRIGGNLTLPRTVEIITLVVGGAGFLIGALFGLTLSGGGFSGMLYGGMFGAAAGVFLTTYSPLQGESMLTWLGLTVSARRRRVTVDGKPVTLHVGVHPIDTPPLGQVSIVRGATRIPAGQFDERGVPLSASNRNLVTSAPDIVDAPAQPPAPDGEDAPARGARRRPSGRRAKGAAPEVASLGLAARRREAAAATQRPEGVPAPATAPDQFDQPRALPSENTADRAPRRARHSRPAVDPAPVDPALELPRARRLRD